MLIVGAGLSGLYTAFQLIDHMPVIIIDTHVGGKVETVNMCSGTVELGPSIIHSNQTHIMTLAKACNMKLHLIRTAEPDCLTCTSPVESHLTVREALGDLTDPDQFEVEHMSYNIWRLATQLVGDIYTMPEGWATFIERLCALLVQRGVQFVTDRVRKVCAGAQSAAQGAQSAEGVTVICESGLVLPGTNVALCISLEDIAPLTLDVPCFSKAYVAVKHTALTLPSIRVYVELSEPVELDQVFDADSLFVWCIPVGPKILLLCYTDGDEAAKRAPCQAQHNLKDFVASCMTQLEQRVGPLPAVTKIVAKYWPAAVTILHGHGNVEPALYDRMHRIYDHVYQTYVPHPLHQAWAEAHLIQAAVVAKTILNDYNDS